MSIANIEKYKQLLKNNPEWRVVADKRNYGHVLGVQKFAGKLGLTYPRHDRDKFDDDFISIMYVFITLSHIPEYKNKFEMDHELRALTKMAIYRHVTENNHHTDYWDTNTAMIDLTHQYEKGFGPKIRKMDGTKMSDSAIIEMCCDWSSVSAEKGNSPQVWFEQGLRNRYKFTERQEELIWNTLEKLWPGGRTVNRSIKHNQDHFNEIVWNDLELAWNKYSLDKNFK